MRARIQHHSCPPECIHAQKTIVLSSVQEYTRTLKPTPTPMSNRTSSQKFLCSPECARTHAYQDAHAHPNVKPHMLTKKCFWSPECTRTHAYPDAHHAHPNVQPQMLTKVFCALWSAQEHTYPDAHAHSSAQSPCKEWPGPPPSPFRHFGCLDYCSQKKAEESPCGGQRCCFLYLERGGCH